MSYIDEFGRPIKNDPRDRLGEARSRILARLQQYDERKVRLSGKLEPVLTQPQRTRAQDKLEPVLAQPQRTTGAILGRAKDSALARPTIKGYLEPIGAIGEVAMTIGSGLASALGGGIAAVGAGAAAAFDPRVDVADAVPGAFKSVVKKYTYPPQLQQSKDAVQLVDNAMRGLHSLARTYLDESRMNMESNARERAESDLRNGIKMVGVKNQTDIERVIKDIRRKNGLDSAMLHALIDVIGPERAKKPPQIGFKYDQPTEMQSKTFEGTQEGTARPSSEQLGPYTDAEFRELNNPALPSPPQKGMKQYTHEGDLQNDISREPDGHLERFDIIDGEQVNRKEVTEQRKLDATNQIESTKALGYQKKLPAPLKGKLEPVNNLPEYGAVDKRARDVMPAVSLVPKKKSRREMTNDERSKEFIQRRAKRQEYRNKQRQYLEGKLSAGEHAIFRNKSGSLFYTVTNAANSDKKYQVTVWDEHGPLSDSKHNTAGNIIDYYDSEIRGVGSEADFNNLVRKSQPAPIETIPATKPKTAARAVNMDTDDLPTALSILGGISRAEAEAQGVDPAAFKDRSINNKVFGAPLFRKNGGMSMDAAAELLNEMHYFSEPVTANTLLDKLSDSLSGKDVRSQTGQVHKLESEYETYMTEKYGDDPFSDVIDDIDLVEFDNDDVKQSVALQDKYEDILGADAVESIVERLAARYADASDTEFTARLKEALEHEQAQAKNAVREKDTGSDTQKAQEAPLLKEQVIKPAKAKAEETQNDMFGGKTKEQQALHDTLLQKEKDRNSGKKDGGGILFSDAKNQIEIDASGDPKKQAAIGRLTEFNERITDIVKGGRTAFVTRRGSEDLKPYESAHELTKDLNTLGINHKGYIKRLTEGVDNKPKKKTEKHEKTSQGVKLYSNPFDPELLAETLSLTAESAKAGVSNVGSIGKQVLGAWHQRIREINTSSAHKLADLIRTRSWDGQSRVKQWDFYTRRDVIEGRYMTRMNDSLDKVSGRLGRLSKKEGEMVTEYLRGIRAAIPERLTPFADDMRRLLDDINRHGNRQGLNIEPTVRNYFPRVWDDAKLSGIAGRKFVRYLINHARIKTSDGDMPITREIAERILTHIITRDGVPDADIINTDGRLNAPHRAGGKTGGAFKISPEKGRKLILDEAVFAEFLVSDPVAVIARHIHAMVTRAEYARVFGGSEQKLNKMASDIMEEVKQRDGELTNRNKHKMLDDIYDMADAMQGTFGRIRNPFGKKWMRRINNYTITAYLGLVSFASIPEFATVLRVASVGQFAHGLSRATTMALNKAARKTEKLVTGKNRHINKDELSRILEEVGQHAFPALESAVVRRVGGHSGKFTHAFMRATGLELLTEVQRGLAVATGLDIFKDAGRRIQSGEISNKMTNYRTMMNDYGLTNADVIALANGEASSRAHIAASRFSRDFIMQPESADLPKWMSREHLSFLRMFKTFTHAFTNTFLMAGFRQMKHAKGANMKLGLVTAATVGAAIAYYVTYVRDEVKYGKKGNPYRTYESQTEEQLKRTLEALDRAGYTSSIGAHLIPILQPRYGFFDSTEKRIINALGPATTTAAKAFGALYLSDSADYAASTVAKMTPIINIINPVRETVTDKVYKPVLKALGKKPKATKRFRSRR